jgi:hypothetical protein
MPKYKQICELSKPTSTGSLFSLGEIMNEFIRELQGAGLPKLPVANAFEINLSLKKRVLSELVEIFSLVEEMVTENRKTVEIGAKEYVRRVKEWSKKYLN